MTDCYGIGLDIGSTTTKGVIINHRAEVITSYLRLTGASVTNAVQEVIERLLEQGDASLNDVPVISTGYGRAMVDSAQRAITEITCHSVGIHHLNPEIKLLIDVGGQDSKVIRIGNDGKPMDFELNDKCSAGTGRFLEVMARVLEVPIEKLGPLALESDNPCSISSTCTVFAESEVIGKIGSGQSPQDIAAGIHQAMASKISTLSRRVGVVEPVAITGGVAKNPAFRHYLAKQLGIELWVPETPQLTGALGAAIMSLKESF